MLNCEHWGAVLPVGFQIRSDFGIAVIRFYGQVLVREVAEANLSYLDHPGFDGTFHVLMDQADCSLPDSFFPEMQKLGYLLEPYYAARDPASRTSIFAPGDICYGVGRMYQSAVSAKVPYAIEVFREPDAALRFAELDPMVPGVRDLLRQS